MCLFGAMVIILIIAVFFQIGAGIGKVSPAYNKNKVMCKDVPMGKFSVQPLKCWGKPAPPGWKKFKVSELKGGKWLPKSGFAIAPLPLNPSLMPR